jgi:hypothetical protein
MYLHDQIKMRDGARFVPLKIASLLDINPDITDDEISALYVKAQHGPSVMIEVDGKLIAACGLFVMARNSVEAWTVLHSELKHKYGFLLTKKIKQLLDIYAIAYQLQFVYMFVESSRMDAQRWAKALGFYESGLLSAYVDLESEMFIYRKDYHGGSSTLGGGNCDD